VGVENVSELRVALACIVALLFSGCAEPFPLELEGYEEACVRLTAEEIPPYPDDPHYGFKHVYACHVAEELVGELPYPDGAVIIKASRKPQHDYPFLVATAKKTAGLWRWAEYTRNFEGEPFLKLPIAEQVCTDCHGAVSESLDWIFTGFEAEPD
jgi:hypothetical protein